MESSIIMLDGDTDQATKQMLENVVKRKKKYEKYKKRHLIVLWAAVFITFGFLYYIYKAILIKYSYSFAEVFSVFVNAQRNMFFLLTAAGLFGYAKILYNKREKTEKEYHALRCEIIDKSKDLWRDDRWKNRHNVFEMMKKEYDINLYHESK
ncbi:DUF2663 family protein [Falsibacillus albus]|uniref:DUF2663 family protein n=1 Tax=Falsibacillus albus TaxID=2478915 RepID=A0A3L7JXS2_9BACI|nr:DUF2663 family protein [Falsibacillus albus]RLQ95064.1 DUF2663 family protein [Falsibacillus albus]